MICERCTSTIPDAAKFCPKCGAKVELGTAGQPIMKTCPQCGSENEAEAKFCRIDGYEFEKEKPSEGAEVVDDIQTRQRGISKAQAPEKNGATIYDGAGERPARSADQQAQKIQSPRSSAGFPNVSVAKTKTSKKSFAIVGIVVIVLLAVAASYLYFTGYFGVKPEKFQVLLNNEIQTKVVNVTAQVGENWVVTLTGTLQNESQRDDIVKAVKAHKEVKEIVDRMSAKKAALDVQFDINRELADAELATVQAMVDDKYTVTLTGFASNKEGKEKAVELTKKNKEVGDIINHITLQGEPEPADQLGKHSQPSGPTANLTPTGSADYDPAKLEGEINRELRNAGLGSVTAAVDSKLIVTLKGTAKSTKEKQRALSIARGFTGVHRVKDMVFTIATSR